jgi:hypothetical protein
MTTTTGSGLAHRFPFALGAMPMTYKTTNLLEQDDTCYIRVAEISKKIPEEGSVDVNTTLGADHIAEDVRDDVHPNLGADHIAELGRLAPNVGSKNCIITSGEDTTNRKDKEMPRESIENNTAPRYTTYSAVDSYVESDMDLDQLLSVLKELVSPDVPEDVCVYEDDPLSGRLTRAR